MCEDVQNSRKIAENPTLNVRKNGEKQRNNSKKHVKKMLTGRKECGILTSLPSDTEADP